MRIAVLAAADSIHSWRWVEFFAGRGHEMHWISIAGFSGPGPADVATYEVDDYIARRYVGMDLHAPRSLATPRGAVALAQAVWRLRKILRTAKPDVFHVHSAGTYGLLGAASGFHPLIVTPWGSDVLVTAKSPIKRPFVRFVLRRADTLTCDAYHVRDAMLRLGVAGARIHIVYFGTDTVRFRPQLDGVEVRRRHGLGEGPVIVSTRSLRPIYDVTSLVQAMPQVLQAVPEARCLIVGEGSERGRLETLAHALGVADCVRFVGAVRGEEISHYLAAADIYVSTSLSDAGLAASTAEAMACGLPVVVTDSAENRAWVADGEGGFIVPVKNPPILAEKLIFLARNPQERRRLGAYNRPVIETRNNYCVEMGKMERLYGAIANGS